MYLEWDETCKVGVEFFDNHHKHLYELIDELALAIFNLKDSKKTEEALDALADYSIVHLDAEEKAMVQHEYPEYESHKASHMEMRKKIDDFHKNHAKGETIATEDLLMFLAKWWEDHIMVTDKLYSPFFQEKGLT